MVCALVWSKTVTVVCEQKRQGDATYSTMTTSFHEGVSTIEWLTVIIPGFFVLSVFLSKLGWASNTCVVVGVRVLVVWEDILPCLSTAVATKSFVRS